MHVFSVVLVTLTLSLLFHLSFSTNSVKPKPGAYTTCGQDDRNYLYRNEDWRLNYKTKQDTKLKLSNASSPIAVLVTNKLW